MDYAIVGIHIVTRESQVSPKDVLLLRGHYRDEVLEHKYIKNKAIQSSSGSTLVVQVTNVQSCDTNLTLSTLALQLEKGQLDAIKKINTQTYYVSV